MCLSYTPHPVRFDTPNDFHIHELSGPAMRTSCTFRLPFEVDERMRDLARRNKCDISILARHAFYEYLQARGIDCFKPIGCL
jgi:hypothetical protein